MNPYKIIQQDSLEEYKSQGTLYLHEQSGAQIYHMANEDRENSFAFSFYTPPSDSTGVPHILEHTVLCGSKNFPIKDPFITLYKGSMHTFLNAFTAPEFTVYPASTVVEKDFFNLMRIYGDAVFFPLLRKEAFMQEGHHVELDEQGNPQRVGIVYNEMKGSYSSHESLLAEYSFRDLFDDVALSRDSGGDPHHIPELTYGQFKQFHEKHYHPSNCRIFLYGDIPVEKSLAFLDEHFLSHFDEAREPIPTQQIKRWSQPRVMEYPAPKGESDGCSHSLNWLLTPAWEPQERVALQVLSQMLIGHGGTPLQMAIQQSPIGEDLSPVSGLELDVGNMVFTLGMRGSSRAQAQQFRALIFGELEKLCKEGFPQDQIEGALRLVEFREREIRGGTPLGLRMMGRLSRSWNYGESTVKGLSFEKPFAQLREKALQPGFWQNLIKKYFLDNPHYSLVTLYPHDDYMDNNQKMEKQSLERWMADLDDHRRGEWEKDLEALKIFQHEEDDPAVLEGIPFLKKEEIPGEVSKISFEKASWGDVQVYEQTLYTRGVYYGDFGFSLDSFTSQERMWMPLLSHCLSELGTNERSYDQLAQQISLNFGGLHSSLVSATPLGKGGAESHFVIRIKMLKQQIEPALELLQEVLFNRSYHQEVRLKELLMEYRNDIRTSLIPNGSGYALTRAAASLGQGGAMDEYWYGITQYQHIQSAVDRWEKQGGSFLMEVLESLAVKIFSHLSWISMSCEEAGMELFRRKMEEMVSSWKVESASPVELEIPQFSDHQSLQVPAAVSFTAAVTKGASLNSKEYTSQLVISHLLKAGFLWENVRMKGGAYGASAGASGLEEYFFFTSYRDPRGHLTYGEYRDGLEYLMNHVKQSDIDLALIGIVGKDLKPLSPAQKASLAVKRDLYNISDELRQKNRNRLLKLTVQDLQESLQKLLEMWDQKKNLAILAGKDQIDSSLQSYPDFQKNRLVLQV